MHEAKHLLQDLALVFVLASLVTILFQRLRQPAVLGYLLAGMIVGPDIPIPLFADPGRITTLSELGVVLVLFSIGLELKLDRLARLLPTSGLVALIHITAMLWLGFTVGQLFGLPWRDSLFIGGMICISSTMIVARTFASGDEEPELVDSAFGLLIMQDLAAMLLIAMFTAIASGTGLPADEVARKVGELILFLGATIAGGVLIVPRLIREAHRENHAEPLLITALGACFGLALLAEHFEYSVALGAFIAGVLVGESGRRRAIEPLIEPLRDTFAAVFFVSIGMLVDPRAVADDWVLILVLTAVVVVGQSIFISIGSFLAGKGVRLAIRTGMSLAQIGEFAFIIAGVGVTAGAISSRIYTIAVGVAIITTFLTPVLVRASNGVALYVERRLPHPVQTFAALYTSWVETLREKREQRKASHLRRLWTLYIVDAAALIAIAGTAAIGSGWIVNAIERRLGLAPEAATIALVAGALVIAGPFAYGVGQLARRLGVELARRALPVAEGVDLAAASRRSFIVALQLTLVMVVGFPLLALIQPFIPLYAGIAGLAGLAGLLGVVFWRSATNLQGHVRAGAEVVLEALARQRHADDEHAHPAPPEPPPDVAELLPGLGPLVPVRIESGTIAVGKSLAELNLRGLTGATVIAIQRDDGGVVSPTGAETLAAGDMLSLTGSRASVEAARELLASAAADESP